MSKFLAPLFKLLGHVPTHIAANAGAASGQIAGLFHTGSKEQLLKNHGRLSDFPLSDAHARRSFAKYFRMFAETPSLHTWSPKQIREAVVAPRGWEVKKDLESGPVVVAMTHSGNWDLAGAWACQELATVVTVAEELEPAELFQYFVDTRESLGLEILPARRGVFHQLRDHVKGRCVLVPLLADRDITGSGIEVDFGGHPALVAAGPAALANQLEAPLWAMYMSSKQGKYTINLEPVATTGDVEADTQAWVNAVMPYLKANLADWHMLQPLFVEDLDQERLARARRRHAKEQAEQNAGQAEDAYSESGTSDSGQTVQRPTSKQAGEE